MEKVKMTHNEYQEFLRANATRFHTEKDYSMEDFNRDADSVEVIGFDLDRFGLNFSEAALAAINGYFSEESTNRRGNFLLNGRAFSNNVIYQLVNALGLESGCLNCYNGFYKNGENRCILEYCEGDLHLVICENEEKYQEELKATKEFYGVDKDDWWEGFSETLDNATNKANEYNQNIVLSTEKADDLEK